MSNNKKRKPLCITLEEAKKRYNEGDVTILDVVDPGRYKEIINEPDARWKYG